MIRIHIREDKKAVVELTGDDLEDNPCPPNADYYHVGGEIKIPDCESAVGNEDSRYKYLCSCPHDCRSGVSYEIAEIRNLSENEKPDYIF